MNYGISTIFLLFILIILACSPHNQDKVYYEVKITDYDVVVSGEGELEAKNAQVLQTPMVWPEPTLSFLIDEGSEVKKGDIVAEFTQTEVTTEYLNALDEIEIAKADSMKIEAELSLQLLLNESLYNSAKASADAAALQLARIKFEAPATQEIKRLEIQQYELEAERARKSLESLKKIQIEERLNARLKIKQAKNTANRAKSQLNQLVLRAPHDGIVVHSSDPRTDEKVREGDALFPQMPVAQIPDLSVMQAKMQINETDAQKIFTGMVAKIFVPSLGNKQYEGQVTRVDRIAKPIRRNSKVKKVEVVIEIDSSSLELRPGLTAIADIFIKRAHNVFVLPLETVFEKDSVRVIYVQEKSHFVPRPVASLYQDEDYMIVYANLAVGEKLALREPPNTRISSMKNLQSLKIPVEADTFKVEQKEAPPEAPFEMAPRPGNVPRGAEMTFSNND